jgi:hypothetical protein
MWKNFKIAYFKIQYLPVREGANKIKLQRNLCYDEQFPGCDAEQD